MSTQADRVLRILLIEDDPVWQKLLRNLIIQINSRVLIRTTTTGESALAFIEEGSAFDLVVTDLSLEGTLSGLDVIQQFCQRSQMPNILVVSSHAHLDDLGAHVKTIAIKASLVSKASGVRAITDALRPILDRKPGNEPS